MQQSWVANFMSGSDKYQYAILKKERKKKQTKKTLHVATVEQDSGE